MQKKYLKSHYKNLSSSTGMLNLEENMIMVIMMERNPKTIKHNLSKTRAICFHSLATSISKLDPSDWESLSTISAERYLWRSSNVLSICSPGDGTFEAWVAEPCLSELSDDDCSMENGKETLASLFRYRFKKICLIIWLISSSWKGWLWKLSRLFTTI